MKKECRLVWWLFFIMVSASLKAQPHHSVIITEIMADPSPAVGLPAYEWIELQNNSAQPLQLQHWRLTDGSTVSGAFPSFLLMPDSVIIICSNTAWTAMRSYGNAIGVSSFPTLDNDGETLQLRNGNGKTIHALSYGSSWYSTPWKAEGGWTLEMINTNYPCWGKENWKASIDVQGGSPGRKNSIRDNNHIDKTSLQALHSFAADSISITIVFNKTLDSTIAVAAGNYSNFSNGLAIKNIRAEAPHFDRVVLQLTKSLKQDSILQFIANNLLDCNGAGLPATAEIKTGWASLPQPGDWIINEILFNPRPSGVDFVECLNNSKRILDLSQLYFATRLANGELSTGVALSNTTLLVFPGDYKVFSENPAALQREYLVNNTSSLVQPEKLPSLPDDDGSLIALDLHGNILDELHYQEDWHFVLLDSKEGVSLERLRANQPTQEKTNWHSAASTEGFATPGRKNSQQLEAGSDNKNYEVIPKVFSPDQDGRDDLCSIHYNMNAPGQVVSVSIFTEEGRLVRHLIPRATTGMKGYWNWEGLDDRGRICPVGIYVVVIQQFSLDGKTRTIRLPVILAANF